MNLRSLLISAFQILGASALAPAATIGLNFCDGSSQTHIGAGTIDGFSAWTDARAEGDPTAPAIQNDPLPLGNSGVSVTWSSSGSGGSGSQGDNEQELYGFHIGDNPASAGNGTRVTIRGLGAWLAANGHLAYEIHCYSNTGTAGGFQPITIHYGASESGSILHAMTPEYATQPLGQFHGQAVSPATFTADAITLTIPPRSGTTSGAICAFKITGTVAAAVPNALTRDRWNNVIGSRVLDLTSNRLRFRGLPDEIITTSADPAAPGVSEENLGDYYGTRHRGFLTASATGWHRFWLAGDDGAEFWLADGSVMLPADPGQPVSPANPEAACTSRFGKRLLADIRNERTNQNWTEPGEFDKFPSQCSRLVHLTEGRSYYLEILHKESGGPDNLSLAWQVPGHARCLVPASALSSDHLNPADVDQDFLPDSWEAAFGLNPADNGLMNGSDGQHGDLDRDGIDNLAELQLGTRADMADTDGDGIDDLTERDLYHTNPLVSNRITFGQATAIAPQQYQTTDIRWSRDAGGALTAIDRRGEIRYGFAVSSDPAAAGDLQPGILELTITASAAGVPRASEKLPLVLSIDGVRFASTAIVSTNSSPGTATVLTPWLTAGPHTLTILHDNFRADLALRLNSISLRNLGGEDLNENGRPDWVDQRLAADNHLVRIPATSLTSPVCIEGVTSHLPGLSLTADDQPVTFTESVDSGYYADVPLDETGAPVSFTASCQSGAITETQAITWVSSDLSVLDSIDVRQGDSLRFDASQDTPSDHHFDTYSVSIGGIELPNAEGSPNHQPGQPFKVTFETPGDHPVAVTYHGAKPSRTVMVRVHSASFGPELSARTHFPRAWTPSAVGSDVIVQPDARIACQETTAEGASLRSFSVNSVVPGCSYVLARLPEDVAGAPGAILARGTVNAFHLAYLDETDDTTIVQTYPDGTRLMRGSIVAVGLPSDIHIRLNTLYQGTVFTNGADTLWLTSADFDSNGIANVFFEWAGQGSPSACTYVDIFTTTPPPAP